MSCPIGSSPRHLLGDSVASRGVEVIDQLAHLVERLGVLVTRVEDVFTDLLDELDRHAMVVEEESTQTEPDCPSPRCPSPEH